MKKSKYLYKKVLRWKREPKYDGILGGLVFINISLLMLCILFYQDKQIAFLTLIFSLFLVFGTKLVFKSTGKGKRKYYTKTRWRKLTR